MIERKGDFQSRESEVTANELKALGAAKAELDWVTDRTRATYLEDRDVYAVSEMWHTATVDMNTKPPTVLDTTEYPRA